MRKKIVSIVVITILLFSITNSVYAAAPPVPSTATTKEAFVDRLYYYFMDRLPYAEEKSEALALLSSGATGSKVAYNVFFSKTSTIKSQTPTQVVLRLYKALLNTTPTASDNLKWTEAFNRSISKESIYAFLINSATFKSHCQACGITPGTALDTNPADRYSKIADWTIGLFLNVHKRMPSTYDFNVFVNRLYNYSWNAPAFAADFFFSPEFISKNCSNYDFVEILYWGVLSRAPHEEGRQVCLYYLNAGSSRYDVFRMIANSTEFQNKCNNMGVLWSAM